MSPSAFLAPRLEPAAHGLDLRILRVADARGEIRHLDAGADGRVERDLGHLDRLLVVRDHALRERHVGLVRRAPQSRRRRFRRPTRRRRRRRYRLRSRIVVLVVVAAAQAATRSERRTRRAMARAVGHEGLRIVVVTTVRSSTASAAPLADDVGARPAASQAPPRPPPSPPSEAPGVCTTSAAVTASTAAPIPASVSIARCKTRRAGRVTVSGRRKRERTRRRLRSADVEHRAEQRELREQDATVRGLQQRGRAADEPQRLTIPVATTAATAVAAMSEKRCTASTRSSSGAARKTTNASIARAPSHAAAAAWCTTSTGTPIHGHRCDNACPANAHVANAATLSSAPSGQRPEPPPGRMSSRASAIPRAARTA